MLTGGSQVIFFAGAVDNQLALCLGSGNQVVHALSLHAADSEQPEDHNQGQRYC